MSFTANSSKGEYSHKLTVNEMPSHNHLFPDGTVMDGAPKWEMAPNTGKQHVWDSNQWTSKTDTTGDGTPHNNLQPYIVVFFWRRTN